jgi:integrating conjugative element relaxase (TIGR03760 family)
VFHKKDKSSSLKSIKAKQSSSLMHIMTPAQGLLGEKRQAYIDVYRETMELDEKQFDSLCYSLLGNLINYYQELAETRNSYFSERGGLVEHAMSRTEAALSMCRKYFISQEEGGSDISEMQQLWLYALYSAGLLQGIGKLMTDYIIEIFDDKGDYIGRWNPMLMSLASSASFYDYETDNQKPDAHRRRLNLLLARQLMPLEGFKWIAQNADVLEVWLALLNEDHRSAGTLGPILIRADALAINRYFLEKNAKDFAEKGKKGRYSKLPTTFGKPQEGKLAQSADNDPLAGEKFIEWLQKALVSGKLMINKSPLFMVPGGMLMSADMFKYFIRESPEFKNWQEVQQSFLGLNMHTSAADGTTTQRFEQAKNQQIHSGVVFSSFAVVLPEQVKVMNMNTGVVKSMSALDAINSLTGSEFKSSASLQSSSQLQSLSASGQWGANPNKSIKNEQGFSGG